MSPRCRQGKNFAAAPPPSCTGISVGLLLHGVVLVVRSPDAVKTALSYMPLAGCHRAGRPHDGSAEAVQAGLFILGIVIILMISVP